MIQSHARLAATPLRPSFSGSCARPCGSERASGSIIDGPGQEGAIAGRPAHDHWMKLAQLRTHTAHYSPVMIAPLSINSSHADCRPERLFFSGAPQCHRLPKGEISNRSKLPFYSITSSAMASINSWVAWDAWSNMPDTCPLPPYKPEQWAARLYPSLDESWGSPSSRGRT